MRFNTWIRTSSAGSDPMSPSESRGQTLPPRGREGLKRAPQASLRVPTHCPSLRSDSLLCPASLVTIHNRAPTPAKRPCDVLQRSGDSLRSPHHRNSVLDARLMSSHGGRLYPEERTASADGYPSSCTFCAFALQSDCRLRHSASVERDSSPTGHLSN